MKTIFMSIIAMSFALQTFGQCLNSEQAFKEYYKTNISTLNPIEGIWSATVNEKIYDENKQLRGNQYMPQVGYYAVIKKDDYYVVCQTSGNLKSSAMRFLKTANSSIYLYSQEFGQTNSTAKANAVMTTNGLLEFSVEIPISELKRDPSSYIPGMSIVLEHSWIKTFPTENEYKSSVPTSPSSGTGFAISSNGIIATNHHVVIGATNIRVRGINGDFSKTYRARVVSEDKNNDLAIIQIDDISFSSLGTIPYVLSYKSCDVGSSIFCLGYPMVATMGDEVKLTNGIISSKSGFQGDITTYQISAPVQPGNSGGPLFDDKGNLIGIINAKILGAENVSYAIKVSYLLNLIDIMPTTPILQTQSILSGKSLSEQVKIIKNFIYIIEIN
jgi:S1-C subfamily serine protease